jgi:putative peptidoglycan lipid II flippase
VALLTRALYARGLWKAPTVCVLGGWLLAVVTDVVLSRALPPEHRGLALGAGHSLGVTVAGLGLVIVVARVAGARSLSGVARSGFPALVGAALGAAAGLVAARALGADPVPDSGALAAVGAGLVAGAVALMIAGAVMMATARARLAGAMQALRSSDHGATDHGAPDRSAPDRQEVHGD